MNDLLPIAGLNANGQRARVATNEAADILLIGSTVSIATRNPNDHFLSAIQAPFPGLLGIDGDNGGGGGSVLVLPLVVLLRQPHQLLLHFIPSGSALGRDVAEGVELAALRPSQGVEQASQLCLPLAAPAKDGAGFNRLLGDPLRCVLGG